MAGRTLVLLLACSLAGAATLEPALTPGHEADWRFARGAWHLADGELEQQTSTRQTAAILTTAAYTDFRLRIELNIRPVGNGVRAAAILFRASGTMSYYWLHLDAKNQQAILVRSTPGNPWIELKRGRAALRPGAWQTVEVSARGDRLAARLDGTPLLEATDATLTAGYVGLGTSQGRVAFRQLSVEGEPREGRPTLANEEPPYRILSQGPEAGTYQAFPDVCRAANGDLLCVFYAGYGHVSAPTAEWPKGGRIAYVRSRDDGRTWSAPRVLFDDADDNRDPHIACLRDGTLVCTFFSLHFEGPARKLVGVQAVRSRDHGETWETEARLLAPEWACSAPVRELPDGTQLLGIYWERGADAWGGVLRSTDGGAAWSAPIPIGQGSGIYLDAETDLIPLRDGTLYAVLRSSKQHAHFATSADGGQTWSPVRDLGFAGHSPHLNRLSTGEILLVQRLPETALYISRDEGHTWRGPYVLDHVGGAYPSTVELRDGTVLVVYYEEGEGSAVRALRFRLTADGFTALPLEATP